MVKNVYILSVLFLVFLIKNVNAQEKPNVLIIYTDDHRYTGVHALGGMDVHTPNIDQLVYTGVAFSNAYLMGAFSGATCIPSRAMLMTGKNVFNLGGRGHTIPNQNKTIGEIYKDAGYYTHIIGKWHQDRKSLARSFHSGDKIMGLGVYLRDHFRMPFWDWDQQGVFERNNAYLLTYDKNKQIIKRPLSKEDKKGPFADEKVGPHTSEVFAKSACQFLEDYAKEQPFLMYLAFHAPHDPRQAPKLFKEKYPESAIVLPVSYLPQHPFDNGHMFLRDEKLAPWPRTEKISQKHLSDYYASITHLDEQIGKVITSLKKSGKYKNTLIVFAGDSGLAVGNHGLMGKQNVYDEDGLHIPLIFSGGIIEEKKLANKKVQGLSYTHDILPTICDFTSVTAPENIQGKSLLPLILNEQKEVRESTYHAYRQFQRAYRKGDFKLIEYVRAKNFNKNGGPYFTGSRVTQLFNIKKDPWETLDLSFFPEYASLIKSMQIEMKEQAIILGDRKENVKGETFDFWDFYVE